MKGERKRNRRRKQEEAKGATKGTEGGKADVTEAEEGKEAEATEEEEKERGGRAETEETAGAEEVAERGSEGEEEEERRREENPESGRVNKRELGENTAEPGVSPESPPTTHNWSIPELANGEGLMPMLEESCWSLTKALPCIDLLLTGSVTDNVECTMGGRTAAIEYSQAPTPEDWVRPPIIWG